MSLQNSNKNSIVSVRSYLNKIMGEVLNNALYELEIRRERDPNNDELFTAQGSIKFVAQFLLENKE